MSQAECAAVSMKPWQHFSLGGYNYDFIKCLSIYIYFLFCDFVVFLIYVPCVYFIRSKLQHKYHIYILNEFTDPIRWHEGSKSPNVNLTEDNTKYERLSVAQCTDGARGDKGFTSGTHVFRFEYRVKDRDPIYGSNFQYGICTEDAVLYRKSKQ